MAGNGGPQAELEEFSVGAHVSEYCPPGGPPTWTGGTAVWSEVVPYYACVVGGWWPVAVMRGRSEGGRGAGPRCRDGRSQGVVSDNHSQPQALLHDL